MPFVPVSELDNVQLDHAVAVACGNNLAAEEIELAYSGGGPYTFNPSSNPILAFPLIEKGLIRWNKRGDQFYAWSGGHEYYDPLHETIPHSHAIKWDALQFGSSILNASMKAYVEKKRGKKVKIPHCLLPLSLDPYFKKVANSNKRDHKEVWVCDYKIGEVWRERIEVPTFTSNVRTAQKLRWVVGGISGKTLKMSKSHLNLWGAGFETRAEAADHLTSRWISRM